MRTPRTTTRAPGARPGLPATPPRGRRAHAGPPADERSERGSEPPSPSGPVRGSLRPRTVRAKIISLLMVPVVSLLGLWGLATVTTAQDVARLREVQRVDSTVRAPVTAAVGALQDERTAALRRLAAPGAEPTAALRRQAGRTDTALKALDLGGGHTVADAGVLPAGAAARLGDFLDRAQRLRTLRPGLLDPADGGSGSARATATETRTVYARYTATITAGLGVAGALTRIQGAEAGSEARVLLELARSGEMLAREDALLASAALTGTLDGERLRLFTGAVATRRALAEAAGADLPATARTAWRDLTDRTAYRRLMAAEDTVLAAPPGRRAAEAVSAAAWERDARAVRTELRAV